MLTLNLVSQEVKKQIKLKRLYKLIKKINNILLATVFIVAIMLLTAKYILEHNYYQDITSNSASEQNGGHGTKVSEINSLLTITSKIQKDFIPWSRLVKDLTDKTPGGIRFSTLELGSGGTIKMVGIAEQRDDLLAFKQNLEDSTNYSDINLPIESILKKENINFNINVNLDLTEILDANKTK